MNIRHNESLRERLAAEYVLGTLRNGARRRLETWMRDDAALRRAVGEWQDRLCPLAEFNAAVAPPPRVWQAIERQIGGQEAARRSHVTDTRNSTGGFWRWLSLASSALAMVLLAVLLLRQPGLISPAPDYVAVLSDDKAQPAIVVSADIERRRLTVKVLMPQAVGNEKDLELWALPKEGAPQSLGLVAAANTVELVLPPNLSAQAVAALAISLEPKGGSPKPNAPTGPILFKGAWVQI